MYGYIQFLYLNYIRTERLNIVALYIIPINKYT